MDDQPFGEQIACARAVGRLVAEAQDAGLACDDPVDVASWRAVVDAHNALEKGLVDADELAAGRALRRLLGGVRSPHRDLLVRGPVLLPGAARIARPLNACADLVAFLERDRPRDDLPFVVSVLSV